MTAVAQHLWHNRSGFSRIVLSFCLVAMTALVARMAIGQDLVVDLTKSVVQVTTGFTGSEVMLYGHKTGPGDVIVVIRGPLQQIVVRRKKHVAGIWVNDDNMTFDAVPNYYAVASNKPLEDVIASYERDTYQVGSGHVEFEPIEINAPFNEIKFFRDALIRSKSRQGLYAIAENDLIFLSEDMFRTEFRFPANVTTGTFSVDVLLVRDGLVENVKTKLLNVRKFGIEATVYDLAHRQSWIYGALAILIAALAGWLANAAFRRA